MRIIRSKQFIQSGAACPAPTMPRVEMEIVRGRARNRQRHVASPIFLLGRSRQCDLTLGDPQFPDIYAYLYVTESGVAFRRLASAPEVTVDGRPIESAELFHGDRLRMGPYEFRMHIHWRAFKTDSAHCKELGDQPSSSLKEPFDGMLEALRVLQSKPAPAISTKQPLRVFRLQQAESTD